MEASFLLLNVAKRYLYVAKSRSDSTHSLVSMKRRDSWIHAHSGCFWAREAEQDTAVSSPSRLLAVTVRTTAVRAAAVGCPGVWLRILIVSQPLCFSSRVGLLSLLRSSMMRKWSIGAIVMAVLVAPALAACPNKCSGHGRCGKNDVCDCMQNWTGGDCSGRVCPFTRAWHDTPEGNSDGHYYAECGNRGICDREKGLCDCDEPFSGSGCRRLGCPSDCSGHGTCEFIEELAADGYYKRVGGQFGRTYTLWDQEKIMGCRCDPGFEGHNCAKRVCPKGDDPLTVNVAITLAGTTTTYTTNEMSQGIALSSNTAVGFLTYHDPYGNAWTTERITFANCGNIQTALRRLPNNVLNTVTVTASSYYPFTRDSRTADTGNVLAQVTAGAGIACVISFQSEPGTTGYQNLLECDISSHAGTGQHPVSSGGGSATCTVTEIHPSATAAATGVARPLTELAECSNRGACDPATGVCKCFTGHMGLACQKQEALV